MMKRTGTTSDGRAVFTDEHGARHVGGHQPSTSPNKPEPPVKKSKKEERLRDKLAMSCIGVAFLYVSGQGSAEAKKVAKYAYDLADAMMEVRG